MKDLDDIYNKVYKHLSESGVALLPAFDNSAWPFVRYGKDHVLLYTVEELHVGDLVLVRECSGRMQLMRVLEIQSICLLLNCDGSTAEPQYYTSTEVKAVAKFVVHPNGKRKKTRVSSFKQTVFDCFKPLVLLLKPADYRNVYLHQ